MPTSREARLLTTRATPTIPYDPTTGNLQTKNGLTYAYSTTHPHAVSGFNGNTYEYDANGNQIQRVIGMDTFDLAYDAENRLVSVTGPNGFTASFGYNGDGQRVQSTIAGVTTTFAGNFYEVSGGAATKYYYAGAARVAMRIGTSLYYLLADHLGSTSLTTNASGSLVSEMRYTAWGEIRYPVDGQNPGPSGYTFTGQFGYTDQFGLIYFNARFLDPALGRFSSADTVIPGAGDPQAWDRYAYANNNPSRFTDPTGHKACDDEYGDCIQRPARTSKPPQPSVRSHGTPTGTPDPTPSSTPCPLAFVACAPTATSTPSPTFTPTPYAGPVLTSPAPPSPYLDIDIDVDWGKIDWIQAGIDVAGIGSDIALIAVPEGPGEIAEGITTVVEVAAAGKAVYDATGGDLRNLNTEMLAYSLEHNPLLVARAGRWIPLVGSIGSGYSLYENFSPNVTITVTTKYR